MLTCCPSGSRGGALVEVDPLFFGDERTLEHQGVDRADVLADDAEGDELDGAEEEEAEDDGGDADAETAPEDQLVNEVEHAGQKADQGRAETREDDESQGHLGQIGNAQHGEVVEEVEAVAGDAALAPLLVVVDPGDGQSKLGDDAAEVGIGIAIFVANPVHDGPVVEAEPREVFKDLNVGEAGNQAVVEGADPVHQSVLFAGVFDGGDNGKSFFPFADHLDEKFGRILEVGEEAADDVALSAEEAVHAGASAANVAGIDDDLDGGIFRGHLAEDLDGAVSGGVIDEELFEAVLGEFRGGFHEPAMALADVGFFVEARRHDGDRLLSHVRRYSYSL